MSRPRFSSAGLPPLVTAFVAAVVVLGPALGPGMVTAYDLAWSPDARFTPFALGTDVPAPRAVPSDAATVVLGFLLTPQVAQKLVLVGILVLAGSGAAALLRQLRPSSGRVAGCAVALLAVWNPFVAERLVVGQWTVLLGYAVLPWAVRACLRVRAGSGSSWAVCGWLVLAGLGGANTWVLVVPVVLVLVAVPGPLNRRVVAAAGVALGMSAAWSVPALVRGVPANDAGLAAFGARADTGLGVLGSLVGGGGFWNPAADPPERQVVVLVLVGVLVTATGVAAVARATGGRTVALVAGVGLVVAAVSGWDWAAPAWRLLAESPGAGLARDAQKFVAVWVMVGVVGVGVVVDALVRRGGAAPFLAAVLALAGPLTLPTLAWGIHGRLAAAAVPDDLRAAAEVLSRPGPGEAALLPWRQYRRYAWNDGRVSLSLVPRMVDRVVRYDDSLPLSSGSVPGEDPRAAAVSRAIAGGTSQWEAVVATGPRYVVVERGTGLPEVAVPAGAGRVVVDGPHVLVVERADARRASATGVGSSVSGWVLTLATVVLVGSGAARRAVVTKRRGRDDPFAKVRT